MMPVRAVIRPRAAAYASVPAHDVRGWRAWRTWRCPGLPVLLLGLALAAAAGALLTGSELRARALIDWQVRLGEIASARAEAIDALLAERVAVAGGLAANPSLSLYMSTLAATAGDATEARYLRHLLTTAALRAGLPIATATPVPANVTVPAAAGLLLVDAEGRTLLATASAPPLGAAAMPLVQRVIERGVPAIDMLPAGGRGHDAAAAMLVAAAPVAAVHGDRDRPLGAVVAIGPADVGLFAALRQPGDVNRTGTSVLLRAGTDGIAVLSPIADTPALARRLAVDTPRLAEALAVRSPGAFAADGFRQDGTAVLAASRPLSAAPWVLMYSLDREEAFAASNARTLLDLAAVLLQAGAVVGALLLAYRAGCRHASSPSGASVSPNRRGSADTSSSLAAAGCREDTASANPLPFPSAPPRQIPYLLEEPCARGRSAG